MSAPDFYFAVSALFRHLHDKYGHAALVEYWRGLGRGYYARRIEAWKTGGLDAVASDWRSYFAAEPEAEVHVTREGRTVRLDVLRCPAIHHLRKHDRDIPGYFCEHCDHICGSMAEQVGLAFERTGGMGTCRQTFTDTRGGD